MKKIPLATQIPKNLKKDLDALCSERGFTISHIITEALEDKIQALEEEKALTNMALERLTEKGEHSLAEYRHLLRSIK